ncbi:unnamed product [Ostreococcus tauri]|uniref:Unnamed product n=1 Tax=Ostreococcus tauri TaxID=70448 RepID=A0A090N350_OSTTA|nr:unnamed product [Ostreococcus tauri]OUS49345.1 hypothetical protein BE221DRAFT_66011 [Ostreococcus tauri]CEF97503.1 unnamed product [Ostreococcus tauri]|eukprot:XP_022838726.1 unnamed product [Ostreococcus tauri]
MNKNKARQSLIAPSGRPSSDTPIARRVAFLREASRAYVKDIPELSAALNMSATTLARESELSRAQIDAYGSCPACGLPKDPEGARCALCGLLLRKKRRRRPKQKA